MGGEGPNVREVLLEKCECEAGTRVGKEVRRESERFSSCTWLFIGGYALVGRAGEVVCQSYMIEIGYSKTYAAVRRQDFRAETRQTESLVGLARVIGDGGGGLDV